MEENLRQAARLWVLAQPTVSAYIASIVRDFRDRDDVLQDTAIAVLDSFSSYDPKRPFVGWALGVARNQVGSYLRKKRRDKLVFNEEALAALAIAFEEVGPEQNERLRFLKACVSELEGRARQMCQLRYESDLKPAAIAKEMGMTSNSVAKALQRIRESLRACIDRKAIFEGGSQ